MFDVVWIPLELSRIDVPELSAASTSLLVSIQVIYLLDILVNLSKSFYDENVREVTDLEVIKLRYYESSLFLFDILSVISVLQFRKVYFTQKGLHTFFLLFRVLKAVHIKRILVEFHQKFYISSKLYFLGYLISVLTIVTSC